MLTVRIPRYCALFLVSMLACETPSQTPTPQADVVDLRVAYPVPEEGIQIRTPDLSVEPYEEVMYCYYDTYTGPPVGVVGMLPLYSKTYGHHVFLKAANDADDTPTGALVDCTSAEVEQMKESVFVQAVHNYFPDGTGDWLSLFPGYAFRLEQNQRLKLDAHFINPTDSALLANAAVNLELIPENEVEEWVGSFDLDGVNFEIPPGPNQSISFDCALPEGSAVLSVGGHMHENGTRYTVELIRGDTKIPLLDVPAWSEAYRYSPPMSNFWPGDIRIEEGDLIRTTCRWDNPTSNPLSYPEEMCTTFGVATGLLSSFLCENGEVIRDGQ